MTPGDLLPVLVVARTLACSSEHVRREITRGNLVGVRVGTHWRVTSESLDRYIGGWRAAPEPLRAVR
jgi:excisionase family DNA binding protein